MIEMGFVSSKPPSTVKDSSTHTSSSYSEIFKNSDDDYRMHLMHCIFKEIWNANFQAPVEAVLQSGAKVLDIGCGVGTWVNDMASDYRSSRFTGVDILSSFPTVAKPFNVNFVQANILKGLPFEDNTFDYVHCRFMVFDIVERQWDFVYSEICRVLKPSGWVEVVESELGFVSEGPYTRAMVEAICQEVKSKNINPHMNSRRELLRSVPNLHHVSHRQKHHRIGSSSGVIGEQLSSNMCEMFKGFLLGFNGEVEIDLTNDLRLISLGRTYENTHKLVELEDHNNRPKPPMKSGNIKFKRRSGLIGGRRKSGISNKENNNGNRRFRWSSNMKLSKELNVEMIIERISKEFDHYQSMILTHRFWARKVTTEHEMRNQFTTR